jgi:hypothetical protein
MTIREAIDMRQRAKIAPDEPREAFFAPHRVDIPVAGAKRPGGEVP